LPNRICPSTFKKSSAGFWPETRRANRQNEQKVLEGKTILGKTIKIMILPLMVLPWLYKATCRILMRLRVYFSLAM
jgi:hypothetical protein